MTQLTPEQLEVLRTISSFDLLRDTDVLKGAKEIAEFTGWSRKVIYHLVADGRLKVRRLDKSPTYYITKSDLLKQFKVGG